MWRPTRLKSSSCSGEDTFYCPFTRDRQNHVKGHIFRAAYKAIWYFTITKLVQPGLHQCMHLDSLYCKEGYNDRMLPPPTYSQYNLPA